MFNYRLSALFFTAIFISTPLWPTEINAHTFKSNSPTKHRGKWTILVYLAADNDLYRFAKHNIERMKTVVSNENINIVVQVDSPSRTKRTHRYFIEKGRAKLVNKDDPKSYHKLDHGDPNTLADFFGWAVKNYPAEKYALVIWDHGIGTLDTPLHRVLPSAFNRVGQIVKSCQPTQSKAKNVLRWICFCETFNTFLTNQKLNTALETICKKHLKGKKIDLLGFDACLMSMLEMAHLSKNYASVMIASQDLEAAPGWAYGRVLQLFETKRPTTAELAKHVTENISEGLSGVTISATDLSKIDPLVENVNNVAELLIYALEEQVEHSATTIIQNCRSRELCASFYVPNYVDLHNLYSNLFEKIQSLKLKNNTEKIIHKLRRALSEGCNLIERAVIYNRATIRGANPKGLSIYLPENSLDNTYADTTFAASTSWPEFIAMYLNKAQQTS